MHYYITRVPKLEGSMLPAAATLPSPAAVATRWKNRVLNLDDYAMSQEEKAEKAEAERRERVLKLIQNHVRPNAVSRRAETSMPPSNGFAAENEEISPQQAAVARWRTAVQAAISTPETSTSLGWSDLRGVLTLFGRPASEEPLSAPTQIQKRSQASEKEQDAADEAGGVGEKLDNAAQPWWAAICHQLATCTFSASQLASHHTIHSDSRAAAADRLIQQRLNHASKQRDLTREQQPLSDVGAGGRQSVLSYGDADSRATRSTRSNLTAASGNSTSDIPSTPKSYMSPTGSSTGRSDSRKPLNRPTVKPFTPSGILPSSGRAKQKPLDETPPENDEHEHKDEAAPSLRAIVVQEPPMTSAASIPSPVKSMSSAKQPPAKQLSAKQPSAKQRNSSSEQLMSSGRQPISSAKQKKQDDTKPRYSATKPMPIAAEPIPSAKESMRGPGFMTPKTGRVRHLERAPIVLPSGRQPQRSERNMLRDRLNSETHDLWSSVEVIHDHYLSAMGLPPKGQLQDTTILEAQLLSDRQRRVELDRLNSLRQRRLMSNGSGAGGEAAEVHPGQKKERNWRSKLNPFASSDKDASPATVPVKEDQDASEKKQLPIDEMTA